MASSSALLMIDLQSGIKRLVKNAVPFSWEQIIENNRKLAERFGAQNDPVYFVTVEPKVIPGTLGRRFGALIMEDEINKYPCFQRLVKFGPSAFTNSDFGLSDKLNSAGITTVFVTGVSLDNGVIKTARDAANRGFNVVVVSDACASRDQKKYDDALATIRQFAKVETTEAILAR